MRQITLTLTLILGTLGCSDEADIGVGSEPVGCLRAAQAEVEGTVTNPYDGREFDWGPSTVSLSTANTGSPTLVSLTDAVTTDQFINQLRFNFYCGSQDEGDYDVLGEQDSDIRAACPDAVTGTVVGQIEILFAEDGLLIVDEATECLAGRFSVDFGDNGDLAGWFSVPWPSI